MSHHKGVTIHITHDNEPICKHIKVKPSHYNKRKTTLCKNKNNASMRWHIFRRWFCCKLNAVQVKTL